MCIIVVDGGWSKWSNWGKCSVSCGVGLQSRSRSCTNPAPHNAGRHCIGQNFDVKLCYLHLCLGTYISVYYVILYILFVLFCTVSIRIDTAKVMSYPAGTGGGTPWLSLITLIQTPV